MASDPQRVQSVFLEAAAASPTERPTVLERACAGDAELRRRVESLLVAHDQPDSFLDRPVVAPAPPKIENPEERFDAPPGTHIGPYKLIEPLGEGGMGTVWVAEQEEPIRRRVALKIIKPGMASGHIIRRFEQERQALALMDHPNIATILDAGVTGPRDGPYFVMELIKGVPITTYCDELNLTVRERLELFLPVCRAIGHAHQKGVIHRDIKPSNVLVCIQDGRPVPKVIDFGIAKAVNQRLTDETLDTGVGAIVGSLQYMCPEQAELDALDVDTRADVYGLGVLLYELLTGTTPLDAARVQTVPFVDTLRMIREVDPPAPSTRLTQSKEALAALAARRRTEPARLAKQLRGELDWIAMKCLEKDRTRRYDSATALARDVEHHLRDEPVEAGPPSAAYRVKKFVRRNRVAVTAAGVLFVALAVGAIGTTAGLVWAVNEREKARAAANKEREAKELAERRLGHVGKYNAILDSVFRHLNPRSAELEGKSLRVALGERLDRAAAELRTASTGDPLADAQLLSTLAQTQLELGYPDRAIVLFAKVRRTRESLLGPDDPDTLTAAHYLGLAYTDANRLPEAVELLKDTLARSERAAGVRVTDVLATMNALARAYLAQDRRDEAVDLFERALALATATHGRKHRDTIPTINNLGLAYLTAGRREEADNLFAEALEFTKVAYPAGHPATLTSMNNLAMARLERGRVKDALDLTRGGLRDRHELYGPTGRPTLVFANNVAVVYVRAGRADDAVQLLEGAVKAWDEHYGSRSREALIAKNNLAAALRAAGQREEWLRLADANLAVVREEVGPADPLRIAALNTAAVANIEAGRLGVAVPLCEEADKLAREVLKPTHPDALTAAHNRAVAYRMVGRVPEALAELTSILELRKNHLGADHPDTIRARYELAETLRAANRRDEALPHYQEAVRLARLAERELGLTRRETLRYMNGLARVYRELHLTDEAVELTADVLAAMRNTFGNDDLETIREMNNHGLALRAKGEPLKAIPLFEEAIARIKKRPDPAAAADAVTFTGNLAAAYLDARMPEKALRLLPDFLAAKRKEKEFGAITRFANALAGLGLGLLDCGKHAEAEELLRECLAIREEKERDLWTTFNTRAMLGRCQLAQKKYADAKESLLAGYTGMKNRKNAIPAPTPARLSEAVDALIELYAALGENREVAKWREERKEYPPPLAPPPRPR